MSALDFISFRAPDLASYPNIEMFIQYAKLGTGNYEKEYQPGFIFSTYDAAVALRALHMIQTQIDKATGVGQAVGFKTQVSEGETSTSTTLDPDDIRKFPDLTTTSWGVELISLMKSEFLPVMNSYGSY